MATLTAAQSKALYRWQGLGKTETAGEAASQTFVVGDLLKIDTSGQLAIAATGGNTVTSSVILAGIALEPATGTTGNFVKYGVITDQFRLRVPVYHGTAASAVTAETLISETYVIRNDNTQGWCIDISTSSNGVGVITGIDRGYAIATQYGPVYVELVPNIPTTVTRLQQ